MHRTTLLLNVIGFVVVASFSSNDDRFIKKYAMMKIYESCFGPDTVKQIRDELKMACAKCAFSESTPIQQPSASIAPAELTKDYIDPSAALFANSVFNPNKLQQAILAYSPPSPQGIYRPNPAYYTQPYQPYQYPGAAMFYGGYQPQVLPYGGYPALMQSSQPIYSNRVSRDMDLRSQLESLTTKMSGKVRNVTCVMQELGYLDANLEPNYNRINERIANLKVNDDLKKDMHEGVAFCQQFSQCIPEVRRDRSPLSRELVQPMFFFKCYKHKKLEACIMKDVREKYSSVSMDDDFAGDMEFRRTGKSVDRVDQMEAGSDGARKTAELDGLASNVFDFLHGVDTDMDMTGVF